mmetsp:Transcript_2345/g.3070  ORF Transcript_2345/g.3070 Transcript_2345/m.3070 type:complete len:338 (-) Transcript_2345:1061-2074(-)
MASATNPLGISSEEYGKFAIHVYQYLYYIKGLEIPSDEEVKASGKLVNIESPKSNKKLVVFDLDETLVHCIYNDQEKETADVYLDILLPNGKTANTGFNIRPYWKEMMNEIQDDWEVVVFTASCKNYADSILDYLDPENMYFQHRFYRETCWLTPGGVYIKDLRVFHQWDLSNIILVDNAVYSFAHQLDNGIPIFPYYKGKDDEQLLYLKEYLKSIVNKDIITELKKTFKMREILNSNIDFLLDFYEDQQENEENADDILDQIVTLSREKSFSFPTRNFFQGKPRLNTEYRTAQPDENSESKMPSHHNEIPRVYSEKFAVKNRDSLPDGELKPVRGE